MSNDKWTNFFRCCFVLNVCICALSRLHLWKALTYRQSIAIHHSERDKDGRNDRMRQRAREHYQLTCLYVQTFLLFSSIALYTHIPLHIHYTHWTDRVLYRTYVVRLGRCVTLSLCLYLSRSALSYTERSVCFLRAACQYSIWQMLKLYLVLSRRMFGIVVHCCWCIFSLSFWWFTLFIIYIFFCCCCLCCSWCCCCRFCRVFTHIFCVIRQFIFTNEAAKIHVCAKEISECSQKCVVFILYVSPSIIALII